MKKTRLSFRKSCWQRSDTNEIKTDYNNAFTVLSVLLTELANAAVAGAILGAKFGICHIPDEWRNGLLYASMLHNKVQEFYAMYQ